MQAGLLATLSYYERWLICMKLDRAHVIIIVRASDFALCWRSSDTARLPRRQSTYQYIARPCRSEGPPAGHAGRAARANTMMIASPCAHCRDLKESNYTARIPVGVIYIITTRALSQPHVIATTGFHARLMRSGRAAARGFTDNIFTAPTHGAVIARRCGRPAPRFKNISQLPAIFWR